MARRTHALAAPVQLAPKVVRTGGKEADDALRLKVTPTAGEHQGALQYSFPNATNEATQLVMHWGKLKVAFTIKATKARAQGLQRSRSVVGGESLLAHEDGFDRKSDCRFEEDEGLNNDVAHHPAFTF